TSTGSYGTISVPLLVIRHHTAATPAAEIALLSQEQLGYDDPIRPTVPQGCGTLSVRRAKGVPRRPMLTPDMRAVIEAAHLCFAATVTPEGRPNLSPKGTIRVWDDTHLFFLDIASPGTRANLTNAPWLELNVMDPLSRRGYRFSGPAALHFEGSSVYD